MSFRKKIIPLSIAFAFGPSFAFAGPLTPVEMFAQADWSLGGPPSATPVSTGTLRDPSSGLGTGAVDVLTQPGPDASGNSMFFHSYGYNSGGWNFFGSRASGGGVFDGTGTFHLQQDYHNDGGAQNFAFNFMFDGGNVSAYCGPCTSTAPAVAMVTMNIYVDRDINDGGAVGRELVTTGDVSLFVASDGSYAFANSGQLSGLNYNPNPSPTGTVSGGGVSFSWASTPMSVLLGSIGAGQDFRLEYDLIAKASGAFTSSTVSCYGSEQQFGEAQPARENPFINVAGAEGGFYCTGFTPGMEARSGDPGGFPEQDTTFGITPTATPEPVSTSLLGLGLGAALLAGRKRKKKA